MEMDAEIVSQSSVDRSLVEPLVAPPVNVAMPRKAPDKHRGTQAELIACAYLLGEGYEVFRNISPSGPADIIACKGTELLRIDVKSGAYHPKLREVQKRDGVVILYVDKDGGCEFDFEREQRFADAARKILAEIAGLTPEAGAAHLREGGIKAPSGAQWQAGTIVQMRQRFRVP
jgi:hypothetical protein